MDNNKTPDEIFRDKQASMSDADLIKLCSEHVSSLCKDVSSFRMSIPPSVNDTDMALSELIRRFENCIPKKVEESKTQPTEPKRWKQVNISKFLPPNFIEICRSIGTVANTYENDKTYYNIPHWFIKNENNTIDVATYEDLPESIKQVAIQCIY